MLTVENKKMLEALPNHSNGEVAYCEEEKQYFMYNDGWTQIEGKVEGNGLQLNLYEINKSIMKQLNPLNERKLNGIKKTLDEWSKNSNKYLLYGKEIGYFTLLEKGKSEETFGEVVISLLKEQTDKIYSIEKMDETSFEIWIESNEDATVLYLMDWKEGCVIYG